MSKKFIITIITILVVGLAAGVAIFLAKGYTISPQERRIVGTGIITVSSEPDSAAVYLDGHLTTATNATIQSLPAKTYLIKVIKEGFIPWERSVSVKEGLVNELKITLFPAIPTIYPLTFSGVTNPLLSPDGSKLAYIVPSGKKSGIWVWTMRKSEPIAFVRSSEPHQIVKNTPTDFSKATLKWSADSKSVLATINQNNFLLNSDSLNTDPRDITPILSGTLSGWDDDIKAKDIVRIDSIKDKNLRKIASGSGSLKWSPDETKFMTDSKVYDLIDGKDYSLPQVNTKMWLPDSRHIIIVEEEAISISDFDGTNKAVIYAGKFEDSFVFPWPDSSRLVIISSFPTPTASEPNFYGINLR